jgi:hypothetical protein
MLKVLPTVSRAQSAPANVIARLNTRRRPEGPPDGRYLMLGMLCPFACRAFDG